ncbi:hypothetical protein ABZW10_28485 [Kitasatospora sp. NPDC004723]|uniref:hypothetical protein n=1 Tax=Kitasatospora sp. NPDC004723 TaxID=3154288 RepID=UPI0033B22182
MENTMTKHAFLIRALSIASLMCMFGSGYLFGASDTTPENKPGVSRGHVYGEGFADSKAEDCDRGFQPACEWFKDAPDEAVAQFNDGFSEAQRDNCEKGFQPACEWFSRP